MGRSVSIIHRRSSIIEFPLLPPMSSNKSEVGRRLHEDRTLPRKRGQEGQRRLGREFLTGSAVQSRGAPLASLGPRVRAGFGLATTGSLALRLGSCPLQNARRARPEPASFFQADGSEAAANG